MASDNPSSTPPSGDSGGLSYRDAGVDIDAGNALIERIKPAVKSTFRPGVLTGIGGFGGLFEVDRDRYREPVLVSGTDGVGTKLVLARQLDIHHTIGIDLVAMCVNDILACGAEPLFFLDYFATGQLELSRAQQVVEGIAEGCRQSGCALIGGETAEMPGMYGVGEYDLAGFAVGVVEKSLILDGRDVRAGHRVIGLASSGPHSNGYSLIRMILERSGQDPASALGDTTLGEALLAPTRLYVKSTLSLLADHPVDAIAHITGGGITENIVRVLPQDLGLVIESGAWHRPPVFDWLQHHGEVSDAEMLRTFNCGIGLTLLVPAEAAGDLIAAAEALGEAAFDIGEVVVGEGVDYR